VFIDETGVNIAMSRRYSRSPIGKRAYGKVPRNHGTPTSLVAALSPDGLGAALTNQGAFDRAAFEVYVKQVLCPTLKPGQIVVMDNLSVHRSASIRECTAAAQCQLMFLPPYSPDFPPIEKCFSKLKTCLRKLAARSQETLDQAITTAFNLVTANDAVGWFHHCGYLASSPM
jgi:transposase